MHRWLVEAFGICRATERRSGEESRPSFTAAEHCCTTGDNAWAHDTSCHKATNTMKLPTSRAGFDS